MATSFAAKPVTLRQWETLTKALLVVDGMLAAVYLAIAIAIGATGTLSRAERVALIALSLVSLPIELGWLNQTRQLLRSFGDDAKRLGRHWSNVLSFAMVVAAYGAFVLDHKSPAFPALLAVSTAPAMLGVIKARALLRGVAGGEIAPKNQDREPQPPPASDDFW